jgi:hypothetical protein
MRIGIVGSRSFNDLGKVRRYVALLPDDAVVVTGDAPGVDAAAIEAAGDRGLAITVHRADWRRYGAMAGPIRNARIVRDVNRLVAFMSGFTRGTANALKLAKEQGIPWEVIGA